MSYPAPYVHVAPRPSSTAATASLVLGLAGLLAFCLVIPSVAAIIAGHAAWRETSSGEKTGHGMAIAGLILGYLVAVPMTFGYVIWGIALIGGGALDL